MMSSYSILFILLYTHWKKLSIKWKLSDLYITYLRLFILWIVVSHYLGSWLSFNKFYSWIMAALNYLIFFLGILYIIISYHKLLIYLIAKIWISSFALLFHFIIFIVINYHMIFWKFLQFSNRCGCWLVFLVNVVLL